MEAEDYTTVTRGATKSRTTPATASSQVSNIEVRRSYISTSNIGPTEKQHPGQTYKMIKIIQFNARSLTKSKLTQFKAHLYHHKPHIATLCETFWRDTFEVKFKDYFTIKKNRPDKTVGGVAILVHKSLQHTPITLTQLATNEATAISVILDRNNTGRELTIVSLYIPDGSNCNEDDLNAVENISQNTILSGDFNAHHERWQEECRTPNQSGRLVAKLLDHHDHLMLATPKDLGTRQCNNSLFLSSIDLTIMPPYLAATSKITKGPDLGSYHSPIHIEIGAHPIQCRNRAPSWNFKHADWNKAISQCIRTSEFYTTHAPETKYQILQAAMLQATKPSKIKMLKTNQQNETHIPNPWRNERCKKAVAQARRAKNACDPKTGEEKQKSFNNFISNLNPMSSTSKTWAFVKKMVAKAPAPDYNSSPIKDPVTNNFVTSQKEKAEIFAKQYNYQKGDTSDDPLYGQLISKSANSTQPNALFLPIIEREVEYAMKNLRSKATGRDQIHNTMIKNLSPDN
ncbi:Uncharacterized protein APZ42_033559 [Daphnia magna]|uniref:Endonuclease/exonuclease/phosphatase domain-containing protein n=1 Tax=Daphnia magna TaxID=35525 RepID=A0A164KZB7_9CRUS|nr:Uncharacterized protein APZ42_033559 [Daphnia magna]